MASPFLKNLGKQGELLVGNFFKDLGCVVKLSESSYDMKKDLIINGVFVEVKTQTIYRKFPLGNGVFVPAFTVDIETAYGKIYHNQLKKCMSVERLIFVARSTSADKEPAVIIYEAAPVEYRKYYEHRNEKDGRLVAGFLISDMTEIARITVNSKVGNHSGRDIVEFFMDEWRSKNAVCA
jgi:hypothetical protein